MSENPPLSIEVKLSNLKLSFIVAIHALAIVSILLISNLNLVAVVLKALLALLVAVSFYRSLAQHKNNISLHFKSDNQADLRIGNKEYQDLQLSGESYVSNIFMQLIFLDSETGASYNVAVFPDSLDAAMHSQLRARLKIAAVL